MNTSVWFKKSLTALALLALATPLAVQASSATAPAVSKIHVQVSDLNLTNAAGIEVLRQRLSNASRAVCGNSNDLKIAGSLKQLRINKACFDATLAAALANANYSTLAQTVEVSNRSRS
ncbi:MAG: UrcA family protein [Gammaproteobacteria bacterium]